MQRTRGQGTFATATVTALWVPAPGPHHLHPPTRWVWVVHCQEAMDGAVVGQHARQGLQAGRQAGQRWSVGGQMGGQECWQRGSGMCVQTFLSQAAPPCSPPTHSPTHHTHPPHTCEGTNSMSPSVPEVASTWYGVMRRSRCSRFSSLQGRQAGSSRHTRKQQQRQRQGSGVHCLGGTRGEHSSHSEHTGPSRHTCP